MINFPADLSLAPLIPALLVVVAGVLVMLADLFVFKAGAKHNAVWLALGGLGVAFFVTLSLWGTVAAGPVTAFGGLAVLDRFALFLDLTIILVTGIVMLLSAEYLVEQNIEHAEFYTLTLFSAAGMILMGASADLMTLWISFETFSIALYVLAAYARPKIESEEAGLKYFFLGAFSAGFFLYGIAMTYGATGTTKLAGIAQFIQANAANIADNNMLYVGLGLILVGLSFKVALVPFHQWTPDVYEGAPTAVTAFMATATKAAGFAALLRVLFLAFPQLSGAWAFILALLAVTTMLGGNIIALAQRNIKRLLAYSSIAHAGYVLIAVVAGGAEGVSAAMFYLLVYALMTLGAFAVVIALNRGGSEMVNLDNYAGLALRQPRMALALAVFMFALTGFPPLAGFVGKWYIFDLAVRNGWAWLAVVGAIASVISAGYYLYLVVLMYMRPAPQDAPALGNAIGPAGVAVALTILGTIILGIFASPIFAFAQATLLTVR